jgi:hypothetical protein
MSWISKLFGKKEQGANIPATTEGNRQIKAAQLIKNPFTELDGIRFGRYSDNNKSAQKLQSWYNAEDLFKAKKYNEAFFSLFDYMRDEAEDNVHFHQDSNTFTFSILQGSKKIVGKSDGENIVAHAPLAVMEQPSIAVMRRMLDLNYTLYYCRTAMNEQNTLCLIFDTAITTASPEKLYYGLRELATKADNQDDMLLADFATLKPVGAEHIQPLSEQELDVKYKYFNKWIDDTLQMIKDLNQDSFSGAIAYLLLTLIYRIDFLIAPEGKLLVELERINKMYWEKKEELPLVERNQMMKDAIVKLQTTTKEIFAESVYRTHKTFAVSTPPKSDKIKEHINSGNKDSRWYVDNKYPNIALSLTEYGVLYNHFIYSMPRVTTDLTIIYMAVLHADYFTELGMHDQLYNQDDKQFNRDLIASASNDAVARYQDKYQSMNWDVSRLNYDNLYEFSISFNEQMGNLNLEIKRG